MCVARIPRPAYGALNALHLLSPKRINRDDSFLPACRVGIADFLLEFAILGHETLADVPNLIHPQVSPPDDGALILLHHALPLFPLLSPSAMPYKVHRVHLFVRNNLYIRGTMMIHPDPLRSSHYFLLLIRHT